jgi:uncharacterized protein
LAIQGNSAAQVLLGIMFEKGQGVAKNYKEAAKWYQLSATVGNAVAQNLLGQIFEKGLGLPKNGEEAFKWYQLSADKGYALAQRTLGLLYEAGKIDSKIMYWLICGSVWRVSRGTKMQPQIKAE